MGLPYCFHGVMRELQIPQTTEFYSDTEEIGKNKLTGEALRGFHKKKSLKITKGKISLGKFLKLWVLLCP
jgi:hypothetical protein